MNHTVNGGEGMFSKSPLGAMLRRFRSVIRPNGEPGDERPAAKRRYSKPVLVGTFVVAAGMIVVGGVFWAIGAADLQSVHEEQREIAKLPGTISPFVANSEDEVSEIAAHNFSLLDAKSRLVDHQYSAARKHSQGMIWTLTGVATLICVLITARRQRSAESEVTTASARSIAP